jgi:tetratricopeptide (TPR) repeat protein
MGWSKALAIVLVFAIATPAFAQPVAVDPRAEARARYQAGEQRFRAGDYRAAIEQFRTADQLAPAPMNAYNIALAHERLGELDRAAQAYREYLARRPDAPNRAAVEARISALEGASAPPPVTTPPPPVAAPPPVARPYDPRLAMRVPSRQAPTGDVEAAVPANDPVPQTYANPETVPAPATAPKSKAFYKHWAFWVVVGVGAIILIDLAVGNSDDSIDQPSRVENGLMFRF